MKDGNEVVPDRRVHVEEKPDGSSVLVFDKVRPKDAGEYVVVAKNDSGQVSSKAPMTVKCQYSFTFLFASALR